MLAEIPDISVIIPTLNEGKNIGPLIERLLATIKELNLTSEILIIDGGSTDETWKSAEELGARCILQKRLGYAGALREGFRAARGSYVLTMDSDLSHPPELLKDLWAARKDADIIIASRFAEGGKSKAPIFRHVLSQILNFVFSFSLKLPVKDLSSGYRLYERSSIDLGPYEPENFNILQEILVRAYTDGYSIKELPLQYEERASGSSHVSFFKFAVSYLPTLYRLWKLRNSLNTADYEYLSYHSRHPLQRYWVRKRISLIKNFVGTPKKIIDIGSGSNYFAATTPEIIALDIEPKKLRFLSRTGATTLQGSAENIPFPDETFDQIILSQVLPYVDDVGEVIKEANRVLKKGGNIIIAVPDSRRIGWFIFGNIYNFIPNIRESQLKVKHKFARNDLVDLLADYGFRSLEYRYILGSELVLYCQKVE